MKVHATIAISAILMTTVAAFADPGGGASSAAPGRNKDALMAFYGEGGPEATGSPTPQNGGYISNLGGAISGGFYGNTSHAGQDVDAPARGHGVTPSISPGPQTVGGGGPGTGTSIGDAIQAARP